MAGVAATPPGPDRGRQPFRPDRVYLGWHYAPLIPDPGPPPRRPTPPEQEQLNPEWVAAQRREENMLNRPLKIVCGTFLLFAAVLVTVWVTGLLGAMLAAAGTVVCAAVAGLSGYAVWQGEQALRARVAEERQRLGKIRAEQESRLFAWQEQHKRSFQDWQQRRAAWYRQLQWYAVALPGGIDRVDVAGGTLAGWCALNTVIGASRLSAGGEVTVVDLSEGAAAADLVAVARRYGIDPLVWVLPVDLPRLDITTSLGKDEMADVLSLMVSVSEEHGSTRDLSYDNAILERVFDTFGGQATVAQVTAALRALAQVGDPRDDVRLGLIGADHLDRLAAMFGRGASERVVIERAWAMESQLRKLEKLGTAPPALAPAPLRVLSTDRRSGVFGNRVLGTFVVTALTHVLRRAPGGQPWQHTVFLLGAERLRTDVLDRLCDACEATGTGLVLSYRSIPPHVRERLGRGNAAVAFMRLGNAEDANAASEQIGSEHRFVVSQLTETVGTAVTDTIGGSYTSTVAVADSVSTSASTTGTEGHSQNRGISRESVMTPFGRSTRSRSGDTSHSYAVSDAASLTAGITASTAWGTNTSRALAANQSFARGTQRSREFLVEAHELQRLPPSAVIVTYAGKEGRHVVFADTNPAILGLPTATLLTLDEARQSGQDPIARPGTQGTPRPAQRPAAGTGPAWPAAGPVPEGTGAPARGGPTMPSPGARGPAEQVPAAARGPAEGVAPHVPGGPAAPRPGPSRPAPAGFGPPLGPATALGGAAGPGSPGAPATAPGGGGPGGPAAGHHDDATGPADPAGPREPGEPAAAHHDDDDPGGPGGSTTARPGGGRRPRPVSWQGEDQPPPNLGPPPARLDWRKPRDGS